MEDDGEEKRGPPARRAVVSPRRKANSAADDGWRGGAQGHGCHYSSSGSDAEHPSCPHEKKTRTFEYHDLISIGWGRDGVPGSTAAAVLSVSFSAFVNPNENFSLS